MILEDIGEALRLAAAPTLERIRRDRRRVPEGFAPLFRCLERHVLDGDFGAEAAWTRSGVRRVPFPLGMPLTAYIDDLRIDTFRRLLDLGRGRIPSGRAAMAVGLSRYRTWRNAYRRCTGENPELVRLPERLSPDFDAATWHHAWHGTLSVDEVRDLLNRLRRLGRGSTPPPRRDETMPGDSRSPEPRHGEITEAEARAALEREAAGPRERLLRDAEGLPENVARVVRDLAEHFTDPDHSVDGSRRRAQVSETAISTRVCFYLGDTLTDLREKLRVEVGLRLVRDPRCKIERIAELVGYSPRSFQRACRSRLGVTASAVRQTLRRTAEDPDYLLWCRAGRGELSAAGVLALEGFLRRLHPEVLARPAASLAVRSDVDPRQVADVLELYRAVGDREAGALRTLDRALRSHPDYSAAHWYSHWIRDRLGHRSLDAAWQDWRTANLDLEQLLGETPEQRLERVREVGKFQTDAFLWLLVDCVDVRLFHDGGESEHFADLALAASEARWSRDPAPESAGFRALTLALKGNAVRRRSELEEASERFEEALKVTRSAKIEPWIIGRIHSLQASFLKRIGNGRGALRALFVASSNFKRAGDEMQRVRCIMDRSAAWFSLGKDPSRILTACIDSFARFPLATDLKRTAHLNRIQASIYLTDRLLGCHLAKIQRFRSCMPPADSAYAAAEYEQVDGLIAALDGSFENAGAALKRAAVWFENHGFKGDAATCWLQFDAIVLRVRQRFGRPVDEEGGMKTLTLAPAPAALEDLLRQQ